MKTQGLCPPRSPCRGDWEVLATIDGQGDNHMVVPPQLAIDNVTDPLQFSKMSRFQNICMGVKPVESHTDVEYRERVIPLEKVANTGPYITIEMP